VHLLPSFQDPNNNGISGSGWISLDTIGDSRERKGSFRPIECVWHHNGTYTVQPWSKIKPEPSRGNGVSGLWRSLSQGK
jgi:hypothetical protein